MDLYTINSLRCSKVTTNSYSTSFSLGIRLMNRELRDAIYGIYGFVRFADEIVDTFHEYDKEKLLEDFRQQTFTAINQGICTNPVLHSFQWVVNHYKIDHSLIEDFLYSMKMDLYNTTFSHEQYRKYVYGSAEVVGLMCLRVFCYDDEETYSKLLKPARKLGEAFQKVNFLRDMKADNQERGRMYFPGVDFRKFDNDAKKKIEAEIRKDFKMAYEGIKLLPKDARLGVFLAYVYYLELFRMICEVDALDLMRARFSVPARKKMRLLLVSLLRNSFNLV